MAHNPEEVEQFVCENCRVTHAGTPIHHSASEHSFEPPDSCGACGETMFVHMQEWIHHHS